MALNYALAGLAIDEGIRRAHEIVVWSLEELGRANEARLALAKAMTLFPNAPFASS